MFIDLRCRVFSDETGVFTEIPAIYTPAGWLMPLVAYCLAHSHTRSRNWMVKVRHSMHLFLEYNASSLRLEAIHRLFGQIPDTLEEVWVQVALAGEEEALQLIDRTSVTRNPFDAKYSKVENADWETCPLVLDQQMVKEQLSRGW